METRIAKLNEKLWDFRIPPGSTQFNNHTFTEQEKKILSLFDDLIEKYKPLTPPPDVLHKIQPLLDALSRIMLGRAVDIFAHTVKALLYIGEDERTQDFDLRLFEAQLWHFIFQRARDGHYEKTWTAAVT